MKNVLICFLLFTNIFCNAQNNNAEKKQVDASEFEKGIAQQGVQVLDVRTSGEFRSGHIAHALQANWLDKKEFTERIQYVNQDQPVYIYCQVGGRSAAAANWLRNNGYEKVIELSGGINAWRSQSKPVEGLSNEPQMTLEQYNASIPTDKTVLVDFGGEWCPPCVRMEPIMKELRNDKALNFEFVKIDAAIHLNLMNSLKVENIPFFIIYKNGKETWRKEGIISKNEFISQLK